MKTLAVLMMALALLPGASHASDYSDRVVDHLYAGTAGEGMADARAGCDLNVQDSCFGLGLLTLVGAYQGLAQDLYRYGATVPGGTPAALLFGIGPVEDAAPANPHPDKLTYPTLRDMLDNFVVQLDTARAAFEEASAASDFVVTIDPLKVRIDLDGNGQAGNGETLGALLASAGEFVEIPTPDSPPPGSKRKTKGAAPEADTSIGFDRADAFWFAGYTQVAAAPFDVLLAHDFSGFYNAYLHRVFPKAGLPMQEHTKGGVLFMDPAGDAGIADMVAAIHTLNFPVTDPARLAGVLARLKAITALSRQNWEAILAETDDNRELVPSPSQTPLVAGMPVTAEIVDAWRATLDTVDAVLDGKLLVPHWRFNQGVDLKLYFESAQATDLVMLLTGSGALPYLRDGPVADAQSFAKANRALGAEWLNYAFWFN